MAVADWPVYPVFIIQAIAFILLFFHGGSRFLGIKVHTWVIIALVIANIGIIISLRHDMTEILHLHF